MTSLADLLRQDKPLETGRSAVYPFKTVLEKKYRFTSRFGDEVLLHKVVGDKIHLPRALCPIGEIDSRTDGSDAVFPGCPKMRPDQVSWFAETLSFLKAGQSGLVQAATGRGKTVCGFYATHHIGKRTLVITTKDDIYHQWLYRSCGVQHETYNKEGFNFLGLQWHEVGEVRQNYCQVIGTKFVVAMIHSLSKDNKYPIELFEDFGLIIFDECHRLPADQFQAVADMFPAKLRLGFTATPERQDGKELLVQAHIGPIRVKAAGQLLIPKVMRFKSDWECPRVLRTDKETGQKKVVRLPHKAGKTMHIEKMMAADPQRNYRIAELIHMAWEKGRKVVVFSSLIDHLQSLHRACHEHFGIPGTEMGYYNQASTKAEKEARERALGRPILFTTFTMMSEGTDFPWLDLCILAMPRNQVEQPVGRIRREYDGKGDKEGEVQPTVIDICDYDSPVFTNYCNTRLKWYKSIKATVLEMGGD